MQILAQDALASGLQRETIVVFRNLRKDYGALTVVPDFSLEIRRGELVCLLGPSGCGKTTTLRMLAGFISPTSGEILIEGQNVTRVPAYRRDVGIVFQNYALFPHMTVAKNVEYGLVNIGMKRQERASRVQDMLRRVELQHLAERYPRELSGGQQQRVALARALALQPKVLLLDEPFSNLDAQLRVRLRDDLHSLIRNLKMTTLFVTHDQDEALTLADRIVVMNKGAAEQVGSPEEIYDAPATRFVAEFVGQCSLLEGQILDGGEFRTDDGLKLPAFGQVGKATAVIRPENVKKAREMPGVPARRARIETSGYHGALTRLQLRLGGSKLIMDTQFPVGQKPKPGEQIDIAIDPVAVRFVPPVQ
ncbi:ABC transporter ATP-binding protein [Bradyrhizobium sp. LMTR 3]|uniref:ABC transporter ATP-binding protein n=1 Tax=Bradyrhizobium sp. LMTR 3 TaxID=189873 RepID=UPI0008109904|nr:ABC transporter ATP-binding protein [Bradyrhizobium sp. LMTR 3]OCK57131.1 Fe3+/spermidine/putrescine ABC transporter ATP-binding protein [Bradyrhizobium sp. LMTR 3]